MARLDHSKRNASERAARAGTDRINDFSLPGGLAPPRQRPSKAELRTELAEATGKINRHVRCACGHSAVVALPASWSGRKLRCSRCGEIAE